MNLKGIKLSERSWSQNVIFYIILFIYYRKGKLTGTENALVIARE